MKKTRVIEDNPPTEVPIWGTELAILLFTGKSKKHGKVRTTHMIYITTSKYKIGDDLVGYLTGTRTSIEIDDEDKQAFIVCVSKWSAHRQVWTRQQGKPVPSRHREVLSQFLMKRWDLGKLRGRIAF